MRRERSVATASPPVSAARGACCGIAFLLALTRLVSPSLAADVTVPTEGRALSMTIYNQDLALVRDHRQAQLPAGASTVVFEGVSPRLLPGSADLDGGGIGVVEQILETGRLDPEALLKHAVGAEVTWVRPATPTSGEAPVRARLLSENGPVLDIGGHVEVAPPGRIVYDRLPDDVRSGPSFAARLTVAGAGRHEMDLSYLTSGLGWHAEYRVILDEAEAKADLRAWAMLSNASGVAFRDADVTLASGDVHQAEAPADVNPDRPRMMTAKAMALPAAPAGGEPAPEDLSGVSLYHLAEPVGIEDRQSKMVSLFSRPGLPARREIAADPLPVFLAAQPFDAARNRDPSFSRPRSTLVLEGAGADGMAGPRGLVRVFRRDRSGMPRLLGEDRIEARAKGEPWRIALGRDGDIGIERTQTSFVPPKQANGSPLEAGWRIRVTNAKAQGVTVLLREAIPAGMTVVEESLAHQDADARQAVWPVKVPARGEAILTYKVSRGEG